ncbi:MAG: 4Fe-4S dicluster domain-containing protein [Clostridiaceae bacterium]|nr:4Fe-4S dicluster domain-containing protein [Clostridiaceae bacterium]
MDILEKIFKAGVVGAGGAGFPTHIKFNGTAEYLLVNAAECEPLLETDKFLMRHKSKEIIQTIELLAEHLEVKKTIIGLKEKNTKEIEALKQAITILNAKVEIHGVENFYPAGDEQILVYELTKRQVPPGGIPKDVGIVVCNVGTIINIKDSFVEKPVTHKLVSILGEVKQPSILEIPIGTSIKACIDMVKGAVVEDYKIILGGPMMGRVIESDQLDEEVIVKTTGAIILLPSYHTIFKGQQQDLVQMINRGRSACIQCSLCTDLCPRNLIGHPLRPHRIMRSLAIDSEEKQVLKEALLCCECGVCEIFACPMGLSPKTINGEIKKLLQGKGVKQTSSYSEKEVHEMREYRKIPTQRLIARLDISRYTNQLKEEYHCMQVNSVKIPLKQHIGKAATAVVKVGDMVEEGQLVGRISEGSLGANVHSSIKGCVKEINEAIWIEAGEKVGMQ